MLTPSGCRNPPNSSPRQNIGWPFTHFHTDILTNLRRAVLVLGGGLDCLANKFSDLCLPPGGFHQWRQQQRPQFCARLPKRLLREEQFLDKLLNFWPNQSAASPLKSDPLSDPTDANNRRSE